MKTTEQLAASLRLSVNTLAAMREVFVFDFASAKGANGGAFSIDNVVAALDGDYSVWAAILANEAAGGFLVSDYFGYRVAAYT